MTREQAIAWAYSKVGQYLDFDGRYGTQCVDFFNYYYQYVTGLNPYSQGLGVEGAKDLANCRPSGLTWIANDPNNLNQLPENGDIIIMDGRWGFGGGYGHVGVSDGTDSNTVRMVDETPSNPVQARTYSWRNVVGWFVPTTFNNKGDRDMIGSGDNWFARLNQLHQQLLGRPLSREVFNHFVGKDLLTFVETVSDHPETSAREALETTWETFYATWDTKINDLSTRPTKQQLDDLQAQLKIASQKVAEAEKKLAEEQAKPPITNTVEIEKKLTISDHITAILSYIKGIFKR